jgi:fatty-acyl-CoA synthase
MALSSTETKGGEASVQRPAPIDVTTVADLLRRTAERFDGDALVFPAERLSYPELEHRAHEMARGLHGLGVQSGEKVAIFMPNCAAYVVALLAAAKLGAVSVPINGRFKAFELGHVLAHSDSRVLLTAIDNGLAGQELERILEEVFPELSAADKRRLELPRMPELRRIVNLGSRPLPGTLTDADLEQYASTVTSARVELLQCRVAVRAPALIMYTSGTTALPKGCIITHEGLVRQGMLSARRGLCMEQGEAMWDPLPLFHTGGVMPLTAAISQGVTFCHPGFFEPGAALDMIEAEHCAVLYVMFDTIWVPIIDHPRFTQADLSAARSVFLVGPPERMRWYQARTPQLKLLTAFGMTEVCAHLALAGPHEDEDTRLTTAGPIQPEMEATIIDPDSGEEQMPGEPGELIYRGPLLFDGYYKQPDVTAASIDGEGWFHSGDLGVIDDAGRFTFRGRLKDMLKVGGENVSPLEIEGFLARHPAVAIAQVVGAPDAYYGEVGAAFVQLRPGGEASEAELIDYCSGQIASFKVPRYVRFIDEWPMSGTKIQKFVLRELIATELREAGITQAPRRVARPTSAGS